MKDKEKSIDNKQELEGAFKKVIDLLDSYDSEKVQKMANQNCGYYDKEKFIVTFLCKEKVRAGYLDPINVCYEYSLQVYNGMYKSVSGCGFILAKTGLFSEKQLKGCVTLEQALIEFGLLVLKKMRNKQKTIEFIKAYAIPYNEKIKAATPKI